MPTHYRQRSWERGGWRRAAALVTLGATGVIAHLPQAAAQTSEVQRLQRDLQQMQRQMETMRNRLQQLEAAQAAATETARAAQREAQAARADAPPPPGRLANSFAVPGTDGRVRMRLSGFVRINAGLDFTVRNTGDGITPSTVALRGSAADRGDGTLDVTARRSRVRLDTEVDTGWEGDWRLATTTVEFDFAGSGNATSSVGTSNGFNPRLRLAFVQLGPLMVGQNASLFSPPSNANPETLDEGTHLGSSSVRQVGVRYTSNLGSGWRAAVALENPYSDITTPFVTNVNNDNNGGSNASALLGSNNVPDLLGALDWSGPIGGFGLRGVVRQIKIDNKGDSTASRRFTESTTGFGGGLGAWFNMGQLTPMLEGDRIFFNVNYGEGLGRYLDGTANGFSATTNFGLDGVTAGDARLDAVEVFQGVIGYRRAWTSALRSNFALGYADFNQQDYVRDFVATAANANSRILQVSANLIWTPLRWLDIGLEYNHVERSVVNGANTTGRTGRADRLTGVLVARF
jgi:hypothetical protein